MHKMFEGGRFSWSKDAFYDGWFILEVTCKLFRAITRAPATRSSTHHKNHNFEADEHSTTTKVEGDQHHRPLTCPKKLRHPVILFFRCSPLFAEVKKIILKELTFDGTAASCLSCCRLRRLIVGWYIIYELSLLLCFHGACKYVMLCHVIAGGVDCEIEEDEKVLAHGG